MGRRFSTLSANAVHTALTVPVLGEDVPITGAGPIGIMAAEVARHAGARHQPGGSLARLIREAIDTLQPIADAKRIAVSNALKFTPEGGRIHGIGGRPGVLSHRPGGCTKVAMHPQEWGCGAHECARHVGNNPA